MSEHHTKRLDSAYRLPSKVVFFVLILFCCFDAFSAECLFFRDRYYQENIDRTVVIHYADAVPLENCTDAVLMTSVEYAKLKVLEEQFGQINPITSAEISISFTWGFGTYLSFWWLAYVIRTAKKTIKIL